MNQSDCITNATVQVGYPISLQHELIPAEQNGYVGLKGAPEWDSRPNGRLINTTFVCSSLILGSVKLVF